MDQKPSDALTKQPRRLRTLGLAAAVAVAVSGLGLGGYAIAQGLTPTPEQAEAPAGVAEVTPEPTEEPAPNVAPTADYYVMAISGLTVTVDAAPSVDSDGEIVSYSWDFGDGGTATGVGVTHSYGGYGSYTVTLTVTDDAGALDSFAAVVDVTAPAAPPTGDGGYTYGNYPPGATMPSIPGTDQPDTGACASSTGTADANGNPVCA